MNPLDDYPHIPLPNPFSLRQILGQTLTPPLPYHVDKIPFHRDPVELAQYLRSSLTDGLMELEAHTRLKVYGENILKGQGEPKLWTLLWRQVSNAMTLILVAALIIAVIIKDYSEGGFIAGTINVNLC
jgi:magnesium-transporting ATPase (P-type)